MVDGFSYLRCDSAISARASCKPYDNMFPSLVERVWLLSDPAVELYPSAERVDLLGTTEG